MNQLVSYKCHRFPPEFIAHADRLCFRSPLSVRLVAELPLERGIIVSSETIRSWGQKFGSESARRLRRKSPGRNDVWHHDEIVQARGDTKAARRVLT